MRDLGRISLNAQSFGEGAMRLAFRAVVEEADGSFLSVVKFFKGLTPSDLAYLSRRRAAVVREKAKDYFLDSYTQVVADYYAQAFNQLGGQLGFPVIGFVPCSVIQVGCLTSFFCLYNTYLYAQLIEREGQPFGFLEPLLEGRYKKYNNNGGWVGNSHRTEDEGYIAAANAFSHFSLAVSKFRMLICDIQVSRSSYMSVNSLLHFSYYICL